ncbi:MAG: 6-phosphofructokinase [Lachnospiraceae bacterium]|nr:6-phosphofructokinase [Lachnospiraceae bacterium]
MKEIKKIAVLTSGGDAPGMNAAIRSVVRAGIDAGYEVYGINRGYHGLLKGEINKMSTRDVSEIIQRGGTMLMTARSREFATPEGVAKAKEMLDIFGIDALVVIGGDGTFRGAKDLAEQGVAVIGIPATIDNDVASTEATIGFDTATNTAIEAIDKIRETASSHERCSVIEVMGRNAGYIALTVGIGCGAECVLIPEVPFDFEEDVCQVLIKGRNIGKHHFIVVLAEGAGNAVEMSKKIEEKTGIETRPTVLGYLQRGGAPTANDRNLASLMGIKAVECLQNGKAGRLMVVKDGAVKDIEIKKGLSMTKTISPEMLSEVKKLF